MITLISKCTFRKAIETIQVCEIGYNKPENENTSSFDTGSSPDDMKLRIKINSSGKFHEGTKLKLKLIGYKDPDYKIHHIDPIKICHRVQETTQNLSLTLQNKKIPIPFGISYIHPEDDQPDPDICNASLHIGYALEYCFVLYIKCCDCHNIHIIPFTARYIGNECKLDYKCEHLELSDTPENAIKVICGSNVFYFKKPHCVTHGQVPRPVILDYTL